MYTLIGEMNEVNNVQEYFNNVINNHIDVAAYETIVFDMFKMYRIDYKVSRVVFDIREPGFGNSIIFEFEDKKVEVIYGNVLYFDWIERLNIDRSEPRINIAPPYEVRGYRDDDEAKAIIQRLFY